MTILTELFQIIESQWEGDRDELAAKFSLTSHQISIELSENNEVRQTIIIQAKDSRDCVVSDLKNNTLIIEFPSQSVVHEDSYIIDEVLYEIKKSEGRDKLFDRFDRSINNDIDIGFSDGYQSPRAFTPVRDHKRKREESTFTPHYRNAEHCKHLMQPLDEEEKNVFSNVKDLYNDTFKEMGDTSVVLATFQQYLLSCIQQENLSTSIDKNIAEEQYYKSAAHTAWRYLFARPNPLIARNALFVEILDNGRAANIPANVREYIAHFWLAASDEKYTSSGNQTLEQSKAHFTQYIALMGRHHNWDNADASREHYDNLERDQPVPASAPEFMKLLAKSVGNHLQAEKKSSARLCC